MIVIGMDTASNRWHTVERYNKGDQVYPQSVISKDPNPDVRRHHLYRTARDYFLDLGDYDPTIHLFCEEPLALKNGKTTRLLNLAGGAIWAAHLDYDITWWWVDVAEWKKEIIGKGNASKDEIKVWSLMNGGSPAWDEDHHDANAIGKFGEGVLARIEASRAEG